MKSASSLAAPFPADEHGLLFRDLLDGLDDPVLVINAACAVQYANPAYEEIFGHGPAGEPARPFLPLMREKDAASFMRQLSACPKAGSSGFILSCQLALFSGEWEAFEIRARTHAHPGGGALFALHLHSIESLIREKQERVDRELRYQALAEQAGDAFFVHDFNGRFVEVNGRACMSLGYSREELLNMSVTDVEQDFDLQSAQAQWSKIEPGVDFTLYGHQRRKDGTLFPVEVRFGCTIWRGERLFLGMARDITERRQAEEKFRRMVEGAPDPVFIQTEGKLAYINPAACRLFGIAAPGELLGTPVIDRVHPDNRKMALERLHRLNVLKKPARELFEQRFLRVDGGEVWVETKAELIEFEGKHGALVFVRDTTERKIAEQKLRESTERFRVAFEHSASGMCLLGTDGTFLSVNQAMCGIFRCFREQMEGKKLSDFTYPKDQETGAGAMRRMLLGEVHTVLIEKRYLRCGKEVFWASVSFALLRDGGGQPVHFIVQVQDITKRKEMEKALLKNARRLKLLHEIDQAVLKGVDSPSTIAGAALRRMNDLLHTKRVVLDIFGPGETDMRVQAMDVDGRTVVTEQKQRVRQLYGNFETLRNGKKDGTESISKAALPFHMAETLGEENVCSFMLMPLTASGKLIGALNLGWETLGAFASEEKAIAQEVASQLALAVEQSHMRHELAVHAAELEQRVKERTAQYEAANKELEAFSYSVSHDLRAPLRSVDGYVQILLEDYSGHLDDNGKRICGVISNSARQMGRLIDDLLSLSRVGRTEMKRVPVDMGGMARAIFHELTTEEERAAIDISIGPLPAALADPTLMRQVWMNLLGNAIKFSSKKEKTVIRVSAKAQDGDIVYSVKDYGAGFDQQYAGKLFGVFQRLHSVREFEGTGVGLAIVQRIINRHGGSVWAQGQPGEGATFYFSLKKEDDRGAL